MSQQSIRQAARRSARELAARRRDEQAAREKRIFDHAVTVMVAIGERDAAIAATEIEAGTALRAMTETEGLPLTEAVAWCDGQLSRREAARLRRLAAPDPAAAPGARSGGPGDETGG